MKRALTLLSFAGLALASTQLLAADNPADGKRSEERRVGKEC